MDFKSLARNTAIYGLSSIVGRFLNYLLVPLYTYRIAAESGGYGIVTNLYAYTALFLALLTFGMETTLFRFSTKMGEDPKKVYGTSLRMVGAVSLLFDIAVIALVNPIASAMGYAAHPEYVGCMAVIVSFDAVQAIMFAYLRKTDQAIRFVCLKLSFIILNILLNLFIFFAMPEIPALEGLYRTYNSGVGLIFFANLICTSLVFIGFIPELKGFSYGFDPKLAKRMFSYSLPLLVLNLMGLLNQVADKILFPFLMPGREGQVQLGIYGACVKIAMIMAVFTQAFRYAYEPLVFNGSREGKNSGDLAGGMKFFVLTSLFAFIAVVGYMPLLRYLVQENYWAGLDAVPIVMLAEIFMGVYFNLSFWYKLSDKTWWGAVMSAAGAVTMIAFNVVMVPKIGYMACAWGGFAGYGVSMLLSFFIGKKKYPIPYDLKSIGLFSLLAAIVFIGFRFTEELALIPRLALNTLVLGGYVLLGLKSLRAGNPADKHN